MGFPPLRTLPRDLRFTASHAYNLYKLRKIERSGGSVGKIFDQYALKNPGKIAIYFDDKRWTFRDVFERSNQIGNFFTSAGLKKGDIVSLFMENRPEYIVTWLGLSKIGVITALINFNLRSFPLKHSFQLANSKAIICGKELLPAVDEIYPNGSTPSPLFIDYGPNENSNGKSPPFKSSINLSKELFRVSFDIPPERENVGFHDGLFLMYTSGTTGLPKSAMLKHARFLMAGQVGWVFGVRQDDTIYTTLPLYHTNAGIFGAAQCLIAGATLALRPKFSASNFWKDCIKYNATAAQYMGETCRYLLRQPPTPEEKSHKVRLMFGNGLRSEIWNEFVERFNIKQISELYGSTEGNASVANYLGKVGSCGFVPLFLQRVFPLHIMKLDEHGNPQRNAKTGLVEMCKPGQAGELICEIVGNHPFRDFKGYVGNEKENEKKIVRDVLKKGDMAFRSGDLLVMDELGFLYFKDRMGESYRWKGENVSTTEVEYVISRLTPERNDVVVFGVKVPFTDGQCGMAVIADGKQPLDLNSLTEQIKKTLPSYAIPLFLRRVKSIEQTGTHKMKKTEFQKDGFDVTKVTDELYLFHNGTYTKLTKDLYDKILSGQIKL